MKSRLRALAFAAVLLAPAAAVASGGHWRGAIPVARDHASAARVVAQLAPSAVTLLPLGEERFGDGDRIVRFASMYRGLAVLGGGAALRIDAKGIAREASHPAAVQFPADIVPALDKPAARTVLAGFSRFPLHDSHVHLAIYLRHGEARLAWFGFPSIPAAFPSRVRIAIDANDGELIEAVDLVQKVDATMYRSNPTASPTLEKLPLPLAESDAGTLAGPFLVAKNCVDRKTVRATQFGFSVHVCDLENSATLAESGNYELEPSDVSGAAASAEDPFSQLSMYFHAARAYTYFQGLQGDPTAQITATMPLTAVANLRLPLGSGFGTDGAFDPSKAANPDLPLGAFDNAFFSPPVPEGQFDPYGEILGVAGGGMFFGQGTQRDFAYDGDVVYHEFTHAVVDKTLQLQGYALDEYGLTASPGAMNEGLADFFSSAIAGDPQLGEYAGGLVQQGGAPIRSLVNDHTCPNNVSGEVHADSTLFSGAMWVARAQLSEADQALFDASIYKAMRTNTGTFTPTYDELATIFVTALTADLPAAAPLLEASFTTKGVLPKCTRVREQADKNPVEAPAEARAFIAPGTGSTGVRGQAPGVVQVHHTLPAGATNVRVSVTDLSTYSSGFGGGGAKFEPKLVVRFGSEPIRWSTTSSPKATSDLEIELAPDEARELEEPIEVPEGATEVFVQIANAGQSDGVYTSLGVLSDAPVPSRPDAGPTTPSVEDTPTPETVEGCGCQGAPLGDIGGNLAVVAAAVALVSARRRRSTKQ